MSDPFSNFKFEWRTDAQNNEAIWFLNPWTNGWEELAMIKWCCHPPEKLQEVDAFFEALQSSWVNALQLTESNRQLREELEKVKKDAMVPNHENMTYKALFGIMERDLQAELKSEREKAAVTQRALAAAKDALQTCRCLEPEQREAVANALARIAEKG